MSEGLLRTEAPLMVDLILLLEIGMGATLLFGSRLARHGRFREHARCQSAIVLLNAAIIALAMLPSFLGHVAPGIPTKLPRAYYWFATAHAALGGVTEILALYVLLAAGTNLLPEQLRLNNYKRWMRTILALWWVVVLSGIGVYARWYIPHQDSAVCSHPQGNGDTAREGEGIIRIDSPDGSSKRIKDHKAEREKSQNPHP